MNFAKYVIKNNKNFDYVAANHIISKSNQTRFSNNDISISKEWNQNFLSLFVSKDGKTLSTTIDNPTKEKIKKVLKKSIKLMNFLKKNENFYELPRGPFKYKKSKPDKRIINDEFDRLDIIEASINSALENGGKKCAGTFLTSITKETLCTSEKVECSSETTGVSLSLRALAEKNGSGHDVICSSKIKDIQPEDIGKHAGEIAKLSKTPVEGKKGRYDILFDPVAFSDLLSNIGEASSASSVESGLSFLANKIGKRVASKNVNIYDDGRIGFSSRTFDSEGTPIKKTNIIKNGILKTYLHNTSTARRFKTKTTGNAGIIYPTPWSITLQPGKRSKEKILSSMDMGIYVTNIWYTRFQNYYTGDFSTIPRDGIFLIKNGKIVKSLKNIRISDNMINILKNISLISNHAKNLYTWETSMPIFSPYVLVRDVMITKPV
ncbi:MAG: TldD/PmbA family protein [Candidatus Aenigmarchaeota archaeon]|nr:TldD/PmbA family protein [Candidatus Aenigmarchaeota archaeon]